MRQARNKTLLRWGNQEKEDTRIPWASGPRWTQVKRGGRVRKKTSISNRRSREDPETEWQGWRSDLTVLQTHSIPSSVSQNSSWTQVKPRPPWTSKADESHLILISTALLRLWGVNYPTRVVWNHRTHPLIQGWSITVMGIDCAQRRLGATVLSLKWLRTSPRGGLGIPVG